MEQVGVGVKLKLKGGQSLELGLDEARELHRQLDELFGRRTEFVPVPQPRPYEPLWPQYPVVTCEAPLVWQNETVSSVAECCLPVHVWDS